jgi:hypothetical protein
MMKKKKRKTTRAKKKVIVLMKIDLGPKKLPKAVLINQRKILLHLYRYQR